MLYFVCMLYFTLLFGCVRGHPITLLFFFVGGHYIAYLLVYIHVHLVGVLLCYQFVLRSFHGLFVSWNLVLVLGCVGGQRVVIGSSWKDASQLCFKNMVTILTSSIWVITRVFLPCIEFLQLSWVYIELWFQVSLNCLMV